MKKILFICLLLFNTISVFCFDDPPKFGSKISKGIIENDDIDEASGLASSYKNKGILWTHNDSGGESRIFAIDTNGVSRGTYYINGADNRDWEDIAIGPGPEEGLSYLYIGDIGDNDAQYEIKYIYRIIEPTVSLDQADSNKLVTEFDVISFTYPDGNRDAETLMIDPITKDIFILSKRDSNARLYRLPFQQNYNSEVKVELAAKLTFPFDSGEKQYYLTAGDISNDGAEILVKSYSNIYYWKRELGISIAQTMLVAPTIIDSLQEPIAEAICWKNYDDNGFFRINEEEFTYLGFSIFAEAELLYYPREIITSIKTDKIIDQINLEQNYPNPFNPTTIIRYTIPKFNINEGRVAQLKIYDLTGIEVATLVNKRQKPGNYKINFNAENLASGVYYYSLKIGNYVKTKKMVILK